MNGTDFGVHAVLAAGIDGNRAQPPYSGSLTVRDIEDIFDRKLGDMSAYSPWMDYHFAVWAPEGTLDSYVVRFEADRIPTLKLSWKCAGMVCYSAIWHIPKSQVVIEIISNQTSLPATSWQGVEEERHNFDATGTPPLSKYLTPLHDSRATTDVEEIVRYYRKLFGFQVQIRKYSDGVRVAAVTIPGGSFPNGDSKGYGASIQYVERPAPGGSVGAEEYSTAWFQSYLLANAKTYMKGGTPGSCWPIWGDNHAAFFTSLAIDDVISRADSAGWPYYHAFLGIENHEKGFGHTALYAADPSGWQLEVNGPYLHPPNTTDVDVGDFGEYCEYHCGRRGVEGGGGGGGGRGEVSV